MKIYVILALVIISSSSIDACLKSSCTQDCNLVNTLVGIRQFSSLVASVKTAGLVDVLVGDGPFTVFGPTDEVFKKLPESTKAALASDPQALKTVLLRHVIPGKMIMSKDIPDGETVLETTAPGESVTVTKRNGRVMVTSSSGTAIVVYPDVTATNGVIHIVSDVI
uniref:Sll1483 n=1 Tax=Caligus rogercresseyi TaxID=217165 RepID=C1BPF3_CALRO|nr:sll1483 precursor [Caligus rogercresseyi]